MTDFFGVDKHIAIRFEFAFAALARKLCYSLRHAALQLRFPFDGSGWVSVNTLLGNESFIGFTERDIRHVVANCSKRRFEGEILESINRGSRFICCWFELLFKFVCPCKSANVGGVA